MRANELNQKYLSIFITADGHTSFTGGPANSPDMAPNKCHCPFPFRWRMMAGMNTEWVHRYIVILSNCQANCAGALLPSREVLFCSSSFDFFCVSSGSASLYYQPSGRIKSLPDEIPDFFFPFSVVVFALIVSAAAAAGLVPVFMTVLNWHYQLYPESPGRDQSRRTELAFFR